MAQHLADKDNGRATLLHRNSPAFASLVIAAATDDSVLAPCASSQYDPDMWYAYATSEDAQVAKRLCNRVCPIQQKCLEYALRVQEPAGIWGGKTPRERTSLLKKQKKGRKHG